MTNPLTLNQFNTVRVVAGRVPDAESGQPKTFYVLKVAKDDQTQHGGVFVAAGDATVPEWYRGAEDVPLLDTARKQCAYLLGDEIMRRK